MFNGGGAPPPIKPLPGDRDPFSTISVLVFSAGVLPNAARVTSDTDERRSSQQPTEIGTVLARAAIEVGSTVGVYRIEARIGAGGMGDVFSAVDTRLDRRVAIKVSTVPFDERFEREARVLSALNHPNVCTLFDIGRDYLVMELLDGETLAARLERGPLPRDEVARYGAQIADALAEAHGAGIVHRDLKPQNVMLTRHGVKVLDFGIAKLARDDKLTRTGSIIGTAGYLAPEQLAGETATERSDLYALGVVLHEMLTGSHPGSTHTSGQPMRSTAYGARPPDTKPAPLDKLVAQLLQADPARRPASAADVAAQLHAMVAPPRAALSRRAVALAAGVVVAALAAGGWVLHQRASAAPLRVVRLTPVTTVPGTKRDPAFSPDGTALAFVWGGEAGNETGVYVLREGQDSPVRLTSGATDVAPAWSPDGKRLAFLRVHPGQQNELVTVSVPETTSAVPPAETKIRDVRQPEILLRFRRPMLAWMPAGDAIVLPLPDADSGFTSLYRVPLDGSAPRRVVASQGGQGDALPAISRDGRWLAYTDTEAAGSRIFIVPLGRDGVAEGEREPLPGVLGVNSLHWSPDAQHLLGTTQGDLVEIDRTGVPTTVYTATDSFQAMTLHWKSATVPEVVFANSGIVSDLQEIGLRDGGRASTGPPTPVLRLGAHQSNPSLSPDGRWLAFSAVSRTKTGVGELWLAGAHGENPHRLLPIFPGVPIVWSPDNRHLAFHVRPKGIAQILVVDMDESGNASMQRQITESAFSLFGPNWSADSRYLYAINNRTPTAERIVRVPVEGGEPEDLFEGGSARVSVDGKRIFYAKPQQRGIYERSLEGDIASNPEQRVLLDYLAPVGFVPAENGIFYVGRDEAGKPAALRFFDFAQRRSFDLGPPPGSVVTTLTVSADGTRLIFDHNAPATADLTRLELQRGGN